MLREIKSTQRNVRHLYFKVDGTGTAAINQGSPDATLTDNGTGSYKLAFTRPGLRLLYAGITPIADSGDLIATLHSDTDKTKLEVRLFDGTDGTTAKDGKFYAVAVLADSADET